METNKRLKRMHQYLLDKVERSNDEITKLHNSTTLQMFEVMFADELDLVKPTTLN